MEGQFIRDLAQKLADENVEVGYWNLQRHGSDEVEVTIGYTLTPEQASWLHVIEEGTP